VGAGGAHLLIFGCFFFTIKSKKAIKRERERERE